MKRLVWLTTGVVVTLAACGGGLDSHGKAACRIVSRIDKGADPTLLARIGDEARAMVDARKSSNAGLRRAANKPAVADQNPGDVDYAAVAAWCRQH